MATNVYFPGNLASVDGVAALRALPSAPLLSDSNILVEDPDGGGIYNWDVGSFAVDDGEAIIRPNDLTPLQAGRWVRVLGGAGDGGSDELLQQLLDRLNSAVGIDPSLPPYNAKFDDATDDTVAINAALADAGPINAKIVGPAGRFARVKRLLVPNGVAGMEGVNLRSVVKASADSPSDQRSFGLDVPGKAGLYQDGHDVQPANPKNMVFSKCVFDADHGPARSSFQNASNIYADDCDFLHFSSPFASPQTNPSGGDYSSKIGLRDNTAVVWSCGNEIAGGEAGDLFAVNNCRFDMRPPGGHNAGNYGAFVGFGCGGEGAPFPYTGPDYKGVVRTEVAETYLPDEGGGAVPRAIAIWRQFGIAVPIQYLQTRPRVTKCWFRGGYYQIGMSGSRDGVFTDNDMSECIRGRVCQNGNYNSYTARNKIGEYSSVATLDNFGNSGVIEDNDAFSHRVNGAAAYEGFFGPNMVVRRNRAEAGASDGIVDGNTGATAKGMFAYAIDADIQFEANIAIGLAGIGMYYFASALSNKGPSAGFPVGFGTNDEPAYNRMAHRDSTVSFKDNIAEGYPGNPSPAIVIQSLTDATGTYKVLNVVEEGTRLRNRYFGSIWRQRYSMSADGIESAIDQGNTYIGGTTVANFSDNNVKLLTAPSGNAGGLDVIPAIPDLTYPTGVSRFQPLPGIGLVALRDGSSALALRRNNRLLEFPLANPPVTASLRPNYTPAAPAVNATRGTGVNANRLYRSGTNTTLFAGGERAPSFISSTQTDFEFCHNPGCYYAVGLAFGTGAANAIRLSDCYLGIGAGLDGNVRILAADATLLYPTPLFIGSFEYFWTWLTRTSGVDYINIATSRGETFAQAIGNQFPTATTIYPVNCVDFGFSECTYYGAHRP